MNLGKKAGNTLIKSALLIMSCCIVLTSCSVFQKSAKKELNDGFYTQRNDHQKKRVYIDIVEDNLRIHATKRVNRQLIVDTTLKMLVFPKEMKGAYEQMVSFNKASFDIDFFTIPLKLRPGQKSVPAQLNANLNGAVYLGFRTDKYVLNYTANPLGKSNRDINHFGFSIGAFTGLGNTFMSPTNTDNVLQQEYDGIVWSKGLAGIFAINHFTVGLALGFDNLLDKNNNIWIYESKPWLGLALGLNLN
ncbi:MAG: hypothetical protein K0S23_2726 [Fluviicola sp.]|jgi:hypothetical protein|uniref:hypothetical protein n=1 Tax=Fluviicola sp. TaxID=1917219 RepID=UPI0026285CD7|nr:hypothetical protein [Fluviicola sp.]MDF3028419.1 hypothetical protein [Fluviicola sp.]